MQDIQEELRRFLFHADPARLSFERRKWFLSRLNFWPLRNGLLSVYPSLKEDVTCDIVVLGAEESAEHSSAECLAREGFDIIVL